jgi:hypothetical protein
MLRTPKCDGHAKVRLSLFYISYVEKLRKMRWSDTPTCKSDGAGDQRLWRHVIMTLFVTFCRNAAEHIEVFKSRLHKRFFINEISRRGRQMPIRPEQYCSVMKEVEKICELKYTVPSLFGALVWAIALWRVEPSHFGVWVWTNALWPVTQSEFNANYWVLAWPSQFESTSHFRVVHIYIITCACNGF